MQKKEITSLESFIEAVKARQKQLKLNNATLSELCTVHTSTINRILSGTTSPKLETILIITKALNMELSYEFKNSRKKKVSKV